MILFDDEYFMKRALVLARQASEEGEVPVGAVAVRDNCRIASAYNHVEKKRQNSRKNKENKIICIFKDKYIDFYVF